APLHDPGSRHRDSSPTGSLDEHRDFHCRPRRWQIPAVFAPRTGVVSPLRRAVQFQSRADDIYVVGFLLFSGASRPHFFHLSCLKNSRNDLALSNLDWLEILERLASYATSQVAKDQLKKLSPLSGPEEAQESFRRIEEVALILKGGRRPFMESLDLYPLWHQRL